MRKQAFWPTLLVGLMVVLALSACGETTGIEATATALALVTRSPEATTSSESTGLGQWAENSGLAMVARTVEDPAMPDTEHYQPKPGTRLVAVELEFGSLSGTHYGDAHMAQLIDDRGIKHDPVFGAMADHPEFPSVTIAMGERVRGWLAFELPEGTTPVALEYNPMVWNQPVKLRVSLVK
jgi:hypothetical protein